MGISEEEWVKEGWFSVNKDEFERFKLYGYDCDFRFKKYWIKN